MLLLDNGFVVVFYLYVVIILILKFSSKCHVHHLNYFYTSIRVNMFSCDSKQLLNCKKNLVESTTIYHLPRNMLFAIVKINKQLFRSTRKRTNVSVNIL